MNFQSVSPEKTVKQKGGFGDNYLLIISAMLKVPDGTFSWKWFKSLAQRSDLNLVGSTWSPK